MEWFDLVAAVVLCVLTVSLLEIRWLRREIGRIKGIAREEAKKVAILRGKDLDRRKRTLRAS